MKNVRVPEKFAPLFEAAQDYVSRYFADRRDDPEHARVEMSGQRYMLVRAGSMSVEFFEMVKTLYNDPDDKEALSVASSLLFDLAHAMGLADARVFAEKMGVTDPIAKLSAGPIHFAYAGWAFVDILEESSPSPDENFFLVYDHPYSFESDSWIDAGKTTTFPVCVMNAGYSSGWCESSFGVTLVASEILCRAKGDEHCRFVMAHPDHIEQHVKRYLKGNAAVASQVTSYSIPGFFARKKAEDALRANQQELQLANLELERRVTLRTRELHESNQELERDIAERIRAESALSESQELNSRIIEALPGGLVHVAADGSILKANALACDLYGFSYDDMTRRKAADWEGHAIREDGTQVPASEFPSSRALATGLPQPRTTLGIRRPDGRLLWAVFTAVPVKAATTGATTGAVVTFFDITARKRAEEERLRLEEKVLQSQKLESLGVLAGGIAHDFNNLLLSILGNASLAQQQVSEHTELGELLARVGTAAERAAELTRQLLAYSGQGRFQIEPVDLSEAVHEMAKLIAVSVQKSVELRIELGGDLPPIEADVAQLRQVIMNLITNAAESIEKTGSVTLRTDTQTLTREELDLYHLAESAAPGRYVRMTVLDTGSGMDAETRAKIFDPFFTTKFSGRGLGLAAVLGIVRSHRGAIRIDSTLAAGTCFTVAFPAFEGVVPARKQPPVRGSRRAPRPAENGLVLLVDDDEPVRNAVSRMLADLGYRVVTAGDGVEAVEAFQQQHAELKLMILDLTMPRLDGVDALRQMRAINAHVPVIVISGYSEDDASSRLPKEPLAVFLAKPFRASALAEKIAELLN